MMRGRSRIPVLIGRATGFRRSSATGGAEPAVHAHELTNHGKRETFLSPWGVNPRPAPRLRWRPLLSHRASPLESGAQVPQDQPATVSRCFASAEEYHRRAID